MPLTKNPSNTPAALFINRRKGDDRRNEHDPCGAMDIDLFHRKRRKRIDRREGKTLEQDYYAYFHTVNDDTDSYNN